MFIRAQDAVQFRRCPQARAWLCKAKAEKSGWRSIATMRPVPYYGRATQVVNVLRSNVSCLELFTVSRVKPRLLYSLESPISDRMRVTTHRHSCETTLQRRALGPLGGVEPVSSTLKVHRPCDRVRVWGRLYGCVGHETYLLRDSAQCHQAELRAACYSRTSYP